VAAAWGLFGGRGDDRAPATPCEDASPAAAAAERKRRRVVHHSDEDLTHVSAAAGARCHEEPPEAVAAARGRFGGQQQTSRIPFPISASSSFLEFQFDEGAISCGHVPLSIFRLSQGIPCLVIGGYFLSDFM
jgi:hypothetical protein